jgi:hypothetical protein
MRRYSSAFIALAVACGIFPAAAQDRSRLPDWTGQWIRTGAGSFDPAKPPGLRQGAPLTPEYQAMLEARIRWPAAFRPACRA